MRYIEPHAHMVSRVTDDYDAMVTAGCAAVCEPAFWAGFDRSGVQGFYDYFCQLDRLRAKARGEICPAALLLALHQSQGKRRHRPGG
jgi:predicted metal-dependent TIM-barrel fold hydrolase